MKRYRNHEVPMSVWFNKSGYNSATPLFSLSRLEPMWPFSGTKYPVVSLEQAGTLQVNQQESPVKTYDYIIVGGPSYHGAEIRSTDANTQVARLDAVSQRGSARIPPFLFSFWSVEASMTPGSREFR
jgi:hypothetical protein